MEDQIKAALEEQAAAVNARNARITSVCKLAHHPELAGEFISAAHSEDKVHELLAALHETEETQRAAAVDSNFGTAKNKQNPLEQMNSLARAKSLNSAGQLTFSQAFSQVMRENPELYTAYNDERQAASNTPGGARDYLRAVAPQFHAMGLNGGGINEVRGSGIGGGIQGSI